MMNNDIKNAFDKIVPTEEQKERMLCGIKEKMNVSTKKPAVQVLRVAAIAAALCCIFAVTAFAEEIGSFFAGVFSKDEVIGENVVKCIYADSDEHIEMTVEEMLSDETSVRLVVHYSAKDEIGIEWLDSLSRYGKYDEFDEYDEYGFNMDPEFKDNNTVLYGVNYGKIVDELTELRTETERCFVTGMVTDEDDWGTNIVIFTYAMTDGIRNTKLDVTSNIEKKTYRIDNSNAPEKLYKPTEAVLSPLSLIIYGENLGFYEKGQYDVGGDIGYYSRLVEEEEIDSLYVVLADGKKVDMLELNTKWNLGGYSCLGATNYSKPENTCVIFSTGFEEPIDTDIIAGIELDGVYYPFD